MCGFSSDGTCRRLFRLVGDLYDTSDLPCVLLVRCNSRAPARREGPCQYGVLFVPLGFREAAAMASRWTPSTRRPPAKKKAGNYLTPGDPIFVDVALPRASFSFDVDFWWSFVWSFTPDRMVTMFVSRTIPAITISSRM